MNSSIENIPQEVINAATLIESYFKEQGAGTWQLLGVQSRTPNNLAEWIKAGESPNTECCQKSVNPDSPPLVMWNPFNKIVQCHVCGQVYAPKI